MFFEPWMFAAMEDEGIMDTRTGRINRVAKFLARQNLNYIGNDEFIWACNACGIDPLLFRSGRYREDRTEDPLFALKEYHYEGYGTDYPAGTRPGGIL